MAINGVSSSGSVEMAISGLRAQRLRMDVIGANIANVHTKTASGDPLPPRRVFLAGAEGGGTIGPVRILGVAEDKQASCIQLPKEMMNLVAASRAYQANTAVLKRYQDAVNVTLELLR